MNQNPENPNPPQPAQPRQLTQEEVQTLLFQLLQDLDEAGRGIVERHVARLNVERDGVMWLLAGQGCLSVAIATYFNSGMPLDTLIEQIRGAWAQHENQARMAGRA